MLKEKSDKPTKKVSLKTLTLKDLQGIAGGGISTSPGVVSNGIGVNHNETLVKLAHLSRKPKASSEDKPAKVRELQTLTLAELAVIAGAGLPNNHNETVVKFAQLSRKPKASSKVRKLQTLTIAELNAIAGAGNPNGSIPTNHNEIIVSFH